MLLFPGTDVIKRKRIGMWARGKRQPTAPRAASYVTTPSCKQKGERYWVLVGKRWLAVQGLSQQVWAGSQKASMESVALPLPGSVWYLVSVPACPRDGWAMSPLKVVSSGSLTYDRSSTCGQSLRRSHLPGIVSPSLSPPTVGLPQSLPCSPLSPRSHTAPVPGLASSHPTAA